MTTINPNAMGALLKKHVAGPTIELPQAVAAREPIPSLVFSFLLWEASSAEAVEGWQRLREATVDDNDLRISLAYEIVEILGQRYPRGIERAERLRASLNDIYRREHAVSLARLGPLGKREQRGYIESLEGITPFVAARTLLLCFGVHGIPIDDRLSTRLVEAGAVEEGGDPNELSATLGRQVKADQAEAVHLAMIAFADSQDGSGRRGAASGTKRAGQTGRTAGAARKGKATGKSGNGA